eukprot:11820125-Alexandrium_andersonii.AAC.1
MYGPAWVVVAHPQRAAVAAAREGVDAALPVRVEGAMGRVWRTRVLRVPVPRPAEAPAPGEEAPARSEAAPSPDVQAPANPAEAQSPGRWERAGPPPGRCASRGGARSRCCQIGGGGLGP